MKGTKLNETESTLGLFDFKEKLKSSTKFGHPKLRLSPLAAFTIFGQSSKTFYGLFDDKAFSLTTNSLAFLTPFILRGNYNNVNGKIKVKYIIEPRYKYQNIWSILLVVFPFVFFNFTFFSNKNALKIEYIFIYNSFLIFMVCFAIWNMSTATRKLEKDFIEIFKIR